jgi:hypothetical protein
VTFQVEERVRRPGPDGTLAHAPITIGGAMLMIEGEWPEAPNRAPASDGSTSVALYVYVENVDQTVERAVSRGAKVRASREHLLRVLAAGGMANGCAMESSPAGYPAEMPGKGRAFVVPPLRRP